MEEIKKHTCSVCGKLKSLTEFHRKKKAKLGIVNICKECTAEKGRKYRLANKEVIKKRKNAYMQSHKVQEKDRSRRYYLATRLQRLEAAKKYREDHKKQAREYLAKYYLDNKKHFAELGKKYYLDNKNHRLETARRYRQSKNGKINRTICQQCRRARIATSVTDLTPNQWTRILKNQKFKCNLCGKKFTKCRPATIDHIIPVSKGGDLTSSNVQALCQSCNSCKHAKIMSRFINSWSS